MSEQQLQFKIVTRFHNEYKMHRGMLIEINNSTNKGAYRKGMGLVKGASDLLFIGPDGTAYTFELKENGSRHSVDHLKCQLDWARKILNRSKSFSFFIFDVEDFFNIIYTIVIARDVDALYNISTDSLNYIYDLTEKATTKTVKIDYV